MSQKGDSPEQVKAYIEARKAKFPSKEKVEKMQKEAVKSEDSEPIALKKKRIRADKGKEEVEEESESPAKKEKVDFEEGEVGSSDSSEESSSEESTTDDSDSESTMDNVDESDEKSSAEEIQPTSNKEKHCQWYLRGNCKFGGKCTFKHDPYERQKAFENVRRQPKKIGKLILPKPEEGLLRKLLEKEIQEEENMILDCFRYFIKTDFLEKIPEE
jgi:hypothetical protein